MTVPSRLRPLRRMGRVLGVGFAGLGFLFVAVSVTPLVSWWATALAGPWQDPRGEVLIVLGGSLLDDGFLGESSYWRSMYAVRAWREGTFREVFLSGGGPGPTPIAEPMRSFLECQGVPGKAIRMETHATSTRENAIYLKEMLAGVPGRKVLLTSDYHMFRADRAFKKIGLDVLPRPYPDVRKRALGWLGRWSTFLDLATETVKIGYYYLRGWI